MNRPTPTEDATVRRLLRLLHLFLVDHAHAGQGNRLPDGGCACALCAEARKLLKGA